LYFAMERDRASQSNAGRQILRLIFVIDGNPI